MTKVLNKIMRDEGYITTNEVAELFGVTPARIYEMRKDYYFSKYVRIRREGKNKRMIFYKEDEVRKFKDNFFND